MCGRHLTLGLRTPRRPNYVPVVLDPSEVETLLKAAVKLRDTYNRIPGTPLVQREFGYYSLERWYKEGLDRDADLDAVFQFDPPSRHELCQLGWCEAGLNPVFDEVILEDRGEHELVQDFAGRHVLYFKDR